MKKSIIIVVLSIILILIIIIFVKFSSSKNPLSQKNTWLCENGEWVKYGNPGETKPIIGCSEPDNQQSDLDKIIVEKYIRDNIKTIAIEEPVLGGSWYVTGIDINPITKTGVVEYEDGHIQGKASFEYTQNSEEITVSLIK